jgi:predicted patatin/cPLA2 family phospholipase
MPENYRAAYSILCCRWPKFVRCIDRRHIMYRREQKLMYELEKQGKAFVFAPSRHLPVGTFALDENENRAMYDLAVSDFDGRWEELADFISK